MRCPFHKYGAQTLAMMKQAPVLLEHVAGGEMAPS